MSYRIAADLVVLLHLAFVGFVVLGGLLAIRRRWVVWFHLPAAIWGTWIELSGGVCPLTPLENALRRRGGQAGYSGGFVEHYLIPILYPSGLTPAIQYLLAGVVVIVNVAVYGYLLHRGRVRQH
ncbi:MAG: DUF2784 domain-containing protein [Gemmatimonadetes bacterium]|nr:DUF2784 domain-containing protein [Gemmatimonadota bacterium]